MCILGQQTGVKSATGSNIILCFADSLQGGGGGGEDGDTCQDYSV